MNNCIFTGNVGKDPEIKFSQNGNAQAKLSIAHSEKFTNKQTGQREEKTTWIPLKALGKTAEIIQQYVTKGTRLEVIAKYDSYTWQDSQTGETKYGHDFIIQSMTMAGGGNNQNQGQHQPMAQHQPMQQPQQQTAQQVAQQWNQRPQQQPQQGQQDQAQFDDDVPF